MAKIQKDYLERVYAGWLGKLIGVRHGAPIEGWEHEQIKKTYGEITDYVVDYKDFAADDDSNGPMFFIRALQDYTYTREITPEQVGLAWLNYAPYEHGFFWWGGYGKSTEHTSYLNLRNGIMAPRSGSIEQNGAAVAEQIGGQIFIDTWGLVIPGNYKLAAEYAEKAASVAHAGNGMYGGVFIAACISAAFIENDIHKIIECGLSVIPESCEYTRVTRAIIAFHKENPDDYNKCFRYVKDNFGYDRYPGVCHIIPNSAVIILSLLYSEGDFSKAINICNICGWDTDCNVANVGTIMGVRGGLASIDYDKWRKPINDFIACSSVIGSLNIMDVPWCSYYLADLGYKILGEETPAHIQSIATSPYINFRFELPGSTHGFRVRSDVDSLSYSVENTTAFAKSGNAALMVKAKGLQKGLPLYIFHKTHYMPSDFHDSRYDPCFSPQVYPGQSITAFASVEGCGAKAEACLYVKEINGDQIFTGEKILLTEGTWQELNFNVPRLEGACIHEIGLAVYSDQEQAIILIDDFAVSGKPSYTIDFSKERIEHWNGHHKEVSQFTFLKGIWTIEDGELSGSCCDFGEAYTGGYYWDDYTFEATIIPQIGEHHRVNFRVQGAIRSYAVGLSPKGLVLYKNDNGYKELSSKPFAWSCKNEYPIKITVSGSYITVDAGDGVVIDYMDADKPYLTGQIGVSITEGSHCHYKNFSIVS